MEKKLYFNFLPLQQCPCLQQDICSESVSKLEAELQIPKMDHFQTRDIRNPTNIPKTVGFSS